ncbi:MAG: hypothetical protein IJY23_06685 [Clostridia bacterium]|nr:hypothetical protein [Clostridia bacterium]
MKSRPEKEAFCWKLPCRVFFAKTTPEPHAVKSDDVCLALRGGIFP